VLCTVFKSQDDDDPQRLLLKDNVDQSALLKYAREAADIATRHQLPNLEFAHNHYGQPDVAMFDFTSMYAAENACRVVERQGYRLLVALVGDTLLEVNIARNVSSWEEFDVFRKLTFASVFMYV